MPNPYCGFRSTVSANRSRPIGASNDAEVLAFDVPASREHPLVNPADVVDDWGSDRPPTITIKGGNRGNVEMRQGVVRRANGVNAVVTWIEWVATEPLQNCYPIAKLGPDRVARI